MYLSTDVLSDIVSVLDSLRYNAYVTGSNLTALHCETEVLNTTS